MTDIQYRASNRQTTKLDLTRIAAFVALVFMLPPAAIAQDGKTISADDQQPSVEMLTCKVLVLDPDANPVEGATVVCTGMYANGRLNGSWNWRPELHGPLPRLKTNEDGIVEMPYPKYVRKEVELDRIHWFVEHPDFVPIRKHRYVADDPTEITLARGFRIALTAVNGKTGEEIKNDLYAVVEGSNAPWKLANNGMLVSPMFAKHDTTLRVCQCVAGQPSLFSELIDIEPDDRGRVLLKDVKLTLGTRVEGRLDESVPRPVKNGNVSVCIVRQRMTRQRGKGWAWRDITPIDEDGSFVFESLPANEVLQMLPVCDGWVPPKPEKSQVAEFFPHLLKRLESFESPPQLIELKGGVVKPVLKMEKAASTRIAVKTIGGDPIAGANVQLLGPTARWYDGSSQTLGWGYSQREVLIKSRTGGYDWGDDPNHRFAAVTDENGVAVIKNLPPNTFQSIGVEHTEFDRLISGGGPENKFDLQPEDLKPGSVADLTIKMQKKGADELDANDSIDEGQNNDRN